MPMKLIQELKQAFDDGIKPYNVTIKPRIGSKPVLEVILAARGNATYTIEFADGKDVTDDREFITPELLNTSPVLLLSFDKEHNGVIDQENYIRLNLVYDTHIEERNHGDDEVFAEYYSAGPEYLNDTQQPAWHLTHRVDRDAPFTYAFV